MNDPYLNAAACDGPGCDAWTRSPREMGFMVLMCGETVYVFCMADCALKFIAERFPPVTTIEG